MASGSPRTRIDQFYASRKRQPQGFKGENLENDRRTAPEESPGAKGSLVNYLVRSPDARHRLDPVKRNLALEIGLSSDATSKPFLSACSLRKTDGGGAQAAEEEELVVGSNSRNSELKKFANDFLSLYCSELPSSVLCPVEQEHKSQKRNLSPLSAEDNAIAAKKKCVLDSGSATEAEYHSSDKGHPEVLGSRKSCKTVEEVVGSANKASLSMKRSSKSPNSSFLNAGFHTPGLAKTPRSLSRSSMFSPGDEFWNEAIQVADGLHGPVDGLNNQGEGKSMCLLMGMKPGGKVPMDASSCIVSRDSGNFPKLVKDDLEAQGVELGGCEKSLEGSNKSQAVVQNDKVSPLPVKHLDFSHDENNFMAKRPISERLETVAAVSIPPMNGSSLQRMGAQPFDGDSSSHVVEGMNSRKSSSAQKLHQIAQVVLDGAKLGPCFLTHTNGIDHQENDYNVSIGLSKGGCGSSNAGDRKSNAAGNKSNEDVSTPSNYMSPKDCLQLDRWLPPEICSVYMKKGISKLYPWQVDCLMVDGVLERRNLVYCASTSAGKSFVAEILMLRRVILTGQMALLVLPYVSICAEKAEHLELVLEPLGKHVRSFYGNQGGGSLPKDTSVAVCTIEKANSLINKLLEEGRLSELSIIVIDELHMVGDQHRGYLLELMLTKLRYAAGEGSSESSSGESSGSSTNKADPAHGLQIIGMSATMPNVAAVADWLRAALYQTDFRPVPLEEYIKIGNTIFDKKLDVIRMIPKIADFGGKDPDHIVELCNEVVQEGHSVLLFCSSRKGCETTARHVSKFLKKFSVATRDACEFNDASSAIEALRKCPAGLDPVLEETLPSGVAYHHAGLTVEEREIVETCYRKGLVRVLTATSTLAAGVNLPARRVIFRQPKIGQAFLDGTRYRQMAGRAGRTGIDTKGESILICKPEELKRVSAMLNDNCPPLQSCLSEDKNGMTHAILEVVAGGIVQTAQDIHRYVRCTLLNSTKPFQDVVKSAQDSLRWLCHNKFLEWNEETSLYNTTPLGRAAFGSSLSPEESLVVLDDLLRAREGFVLASDLHLVYLVTPINIDIEPDWELYYERFMELSALDQSVGNRVGVVEPFLMRMAHGAPLLRHNGFKGKKVGPYNSPQTRNAAGDNILLSSDKALRVSKRFYVALMLSRLIQEVPVADVCMAFKVARGMIQALQENAGRFASMVSLFCERLGWQDLEGLVAKFQNRVSFGVRAEIVELTNIPYVKGSRARSLYKAGLRTPLAIAEASVSDIVKALFEFTSWAGEESLALRRMQLGIAKKIKSGARKIILDQAEEARLAAFSAFKSLGFHVPQFSRPLLPINAEGSASEGGSMGSSHEGSTSCFDASKSGKNVHVSMQQAGEDKSLLCGDASQATTRQNFYKNSSDLAAKQVSSAIATVGDPNIENAEPVTEVFPKSLVSLGKFDATDVETSAPASSPMQKKGDITGDVDVKTGPSYIGEHVQGDNKADSFGANISDEGPVSVNTTEGGLDLFLDKWDAAKEFYFDVHFTKHSEVNSCILFEVSGFAICWENSPVYYINLMKDLVASGKQYKCHGRLRSSTDYKNRGLPSGDTWKVAKYRWKRIAKIMERSGVRKITWNLKVQIQVLKIPTISLQRYGRLSLEHNDFDGLEVVNGPYLVLPSISIHDGIDMCLVSWILWPDEESKSSPNLEKVVKKRLSSEAAAAANRDGRWRNQMHKAAHNGCCRRVAQIRALDSVLWKLLVSENLVETLTEVENPLVKVLADMELWGIGIDMEACLCARHILVRKLKELEKEAYDLAGMHFSLNNAADIANVLYKHLKLPIPGSCTKGKQHPSTNKHSLDLLRDQHPIIAVIKEHRSLAKLLNGTLGSICSRAKLCAKSHRYTIHGHWLQTSTATGRLSIEEPNLQCIEHMVVFKSQQSEEKLKCSPEIDHHQINARDFFIPTEDNWLLLTADYSQIELRLMAHFSKDSSLIELLSEPNDDVFTMIAARWASKRESAVSSQERDHTKRLVYGILYGMGTHTLAEQLECSSEEATEKIKSFKASFHGVSSWLQAAVASCHQKGYVETLNGRKRFLPKIKFGNSKERAKAQRQAVNSICQGSAADIIKIAMINIHSVIAKECKTPDMNSGPWTNFTMLKGHCRIILQVHDELVLEVDAKFLKEAGSLLQMSMESAVSLLVPLHVKLKSGRTWGSLQPFKQEP